MPLCTSGGLIFWSCLPPALRSTSPSFTTFKSFLFGLSFCLYTVHWLYMFSALAAVCTVDCAIEIVWITWHYITLLFWSWSSEFGLVYITGCCFRGSCKCSTRPRPIRCEPRFHLFELVIHAKPKRRRMLNSVIDEHRRERTNRQFWSAITDY